MLDSTKNRRTKVCVGCGEDYIVSQKKALAKSKFCTHGCYLSSRSSEEMAEMAKKAATHGMYNTKIYKVWSAMVQRCTNPNNGAYDVYGGAGIDVSKKWRFFIYFYKDMGRNFEDGLTLDRKDGAKGYSKENCRWATRKEQSSNLKNNVWVDCDGEKVCAAECARRLGVHPSTIMYRIKRGKLKRL